MGKARLSKATGKRARSSSEEEVSLVDYKIIAISATFSSWESMSLLKAYLHAIYFPLLRKEALLSKPSKVISAR